VGNASLLNATVNDIGTNLDEMESVRIARADASTGDNDDGNAVLLTQGLE
jgi:hypothetical protein